MSISIHLLVKPANFLKSITKYMKMYTNFNTITQETYKFSKIYNKLHEKVYKKIKIFHNMTYKT